MKTPKQLGNIAKVLVSDGSFSLITNTDGLPDNHIDFNLFSAQTDRMIVLSKKGEKYLL
jgi:hypothetical protein